MINFLRNVFKEKKWAASLLLIRVASGLVVQKLVALQFGPYGTTLLSHLQNFTGLFLQPSQDIVGQGILTFQTDKKKEGAQVIAVALIYLILLFLVVFSLTWLYQKAELEKLAFIQTHLSELVVAIIFLMLQIICTNLLLKQAHLKPLVLIAMIQWTVIITSLALFNQNIEQQLIAYLISNAASTLLYLFTCLYYKIIPIQFSNIPKRVNKHFLQFLLIGFTIWLCSKLTAYGIRSYAISAYSVEETGWWQAVARLSDAYRALFISYLMISFVPKLSQSKSLEKSKAIIRKDLSTYFLLATGFIVFAFLSQDYLISFFYNASYAPATDLLSIQLVGDIFALASFPFALILIAKVETKRYIIAEIASTLVYLLSIYLLPELGITKILYAHFVRYMFYLILVFMFAFKHLKK